MGKAQQTLTNGIPPVLKRNMACHQCRKRKLKCDAQRPCATCKRSHANLLATAMPGVDVPSEPVCTYDELPEPKEPVEKLPGEGGIRAKYERLEARIAELEGQLREREQFSAALLARGAGTGVGGIHHPYHSPADPYGTLSTSPLARLTISDPFEQLSATIQNSYAAAAAMNMNPMLVSHHQHQHQHQQQHQQSPYTPLSMGMDNTNSNSNPNTNTLLYPNWPTRLPSPALLHHLVEIFFTCHPHAQRLLHRPRFFASLTLPPTHPDFPSLSLLHAICALASLWSPLVEREGMPDLNERPAEEIFQEHARRKVREQRARFGLGPVSTDGALPTANGTEEEGGASDIGGGIGGGGVGLGAGLGETRERAALNGRTNAAPKGEWFGEAHARWSREEEEKNATEGTSVFQGLQSIVVLTWYYYAHARWVEVWLYTSKALRYAVPMGLNTTPTHGPLLRSWTMPSILGPPKDAIEAEMRRTTFWLAYCYERWQAASTGWAMALDDEDISQVLSLPLKDFEAGLSLLPELRQRISTPRMLTLHIPEQTDAFTLYVKGTILFSKVKNFNIRFKSKYYYAVASSSTHGDRFGTFGAHQANAPAPAPVPRPSPTPTPSASAAAAAVAGMYQSYSAQPFGFSVSGSSIDQTMLDDQQQQQQSGSAGGDSVTTSSSTSSMMKHIRGPSPDMAPLASLGTSGVLQDAQQSPTNHGGSNGVTTTTTNGATTSATTRTIVKNDPTVVVVDPTSPSSLSLGGPSNPLSSTSQLLEGTRWHPYSAPQELFSPATTGNPPPGPMGAYASPPGQGPERIDPRDTPSFRAVDGLIEGFRTSFPRHLRDPVEGGRVDSELYVACLVPHVATILLHDPHADPSAPECRSADKLLTAARAILDLVYILRATSFDITHLDPVASFAWFLAARVFVRLLRARLDGRRIAEAVALRAELEVIRLALKKLGERVPLGFRQSKMLDDLLANEVGNALDDPSTYSYAFTTTSPDGQQSSIALPPNGSPTDTYTNVNGHRGSFSGPPGVSPATTHLPHLGHRDSLSLPHDPHLSAHSGMNSRRTSFSAQGTTTTAGGGEDGLPLPRDGNTKNVMLHQLPTMMNISYDSNVPHSTPDSATLQTPQFGVPLPPVTDIHHKFMESMKSQDERDLEVYHESGAAAAVGEIPAPGVGGGRLEMLLGEMVDDGDGDGVFGGVSGMGVLGANMGNNNGFPIGSGVGIAGTGIGFVNEYGLVTGGW